MTAKKINNCNICLNCLNEFIDKEIYWVAANFGVMSVMHCMSCIEEKGITEYKPYLKPRKKREKKETTVEKKSIKSKKTNVKGT